jgi:hypothetical protein
MTMRRLLLLPMTALVALLLTGCLDLNVTTKAEPLPIPADKAVAVRPCDEDAASRVLQYYKLMTRSSAAGTAKTSTVVYATDEWGATIDCKIPITSPNRNKEEADEVIFTIASSMEFKDWWVNEYLPSIGAVPQTEFGTKPGEEIIIAVRGTEPVEVVWVANDGLFMTARAGNFDMSVPEQRAMLLAVANEIHETYKDFAGVPG